MPMHITPDGTRLHFKVWGEGPPVLLSHGWPLSADSWDRPMRALAQAGFRCIAHDRRGHGRSDQPWHGNDMDTCADDLASLLGTLGYGKVALVGFSAGGGEVARLIGRHGAAGCSRIALIGAVPPLMLKSADNPHGTDREVFDTFREQLLTDRSKFYKDTAGGPFYGFNRLLTRTHESWVEAFWLQGMMGGLHNHYEGIAAFSETDFTEDLRRFTMPTLIVHGDEDQVVPIKASARAAATLVPQATCMVYDGAPHGLIDSHTDQLIGDLLGFLRDH